MKVRLRVKFRGIVRARTRVRLRLSFIGSVRFSIATSFQLRVP